MDSSRTQSQAFTFECFLHEKDLRIKASISVSGGGGKGPLCSKCLSQQDLVPLPPSSPEALGHQPNRTKGTEVEPRVQMAVNMVEWPLETKQQDESTVLFQG